MRGEDDNDKKYPIVCHGSPPHARGRRAFAADMHDVPRITPACAGKTSPLAVVLKTPMDHPRMRGED